MSLLAFRCSGCGNCCRDPLLPLTDDDLRRLVAGTEAAWPDLVQWVSTSGIDLDDRRWFVSLRQGPRAMVLRHRRGRCVYLDRNDRCTAYASRPIGCRVYPLDPEFSARGTLRRLRLIEATNCPSSMAGNNDIGALLELHRQYDAENETYLERVARWNRQQRARRRRSLKPETARRFLEFLGL